MLLRLTLLAFSLLAVLSDRSRAQDGLQSSVGLSATEILTRVAEVYANCNSYRDAGVVESTLSDPSDSGGERDRSRSLVGSDHSSKPFRTAFLRPDRFRFEFGVARGDRMQRYIVWGWGSEVRRWWDLDNKEERFFTLSMGIAGATGISSGAAHTIPRLLLPQRLMGTRIVDLVDAQRQPDAELEGDACFRIHGLFAGRVPTTLWIDQARFLIRRIDEENDIASDLHVSETTTYEPEIDVDISASELAFDRPAAQPEQEHKPRASSVDPEVVSRYHKVTKLIDDGDGDAALPELEWLWTATNNPDSAFEPAIRPHIVEAIGRLAAVHAATRERFVAIFEELDAAVRSGGNFRAWTDWADLGRALKLDDRIVQLYLDRRSPSGSISQDDFHTYALDELFEILVERRQYADAGSLSADPVREAKRDYDMIAGIADEYPADDVQAIAGHLLLRAREADSLLYAVTVAAGRTSEAEGIVQLMLAEDDTVEARRALALACLRADVAAVAVRGWIEEIRRRGGDVADLEALRSAPPPTESDAAPR